MITFKRGALKEKERRRTGGADSRWRRLHTGRSGGDEERLKGVVDQLGQENAARAERCTSGVFYFGGSAIDDPG